MSEIIPFDLKISAGEYLAGDIGSTIEFSRTFPNGVSFGAFATFTDVSTEQFGEGSFDKGIFFNIPILCPYYFHCNFLLLPIIYPCFSGSIFKNKLFRWVRFFNLCNESIGKSSR